MQASKRLEVGWGLGCGAWGLGIRDIYYIYRIQGISGFRAKGL